MDYLELIDEEKKVLQRFPLDRDMHSLGREAPADIVVENKAVSREHGIIRRAGPYLYYQDYGSTNGSWVNGERLSPQRRYIIRHGDVLQLSNSLFRIHRESPVHRTTLIVLQEGEYLGDHPILASGVVLVLGAGNDYYPLADGSVVFEVQRAELFVSARKTDSPIVRNGSRIAGDKALSDRDEVRVGQYSVLIHVPELRASGDYHETGATSIFGHGSSGAGNRGAGNSGAGSYGSGPGTSSRSNFGRFREEGSTTIIDGTQVEGMMEYGEDSTTLSGYSSRDTRRTMEDIGGPIYEHKEFEQKVISWVGIALLGILLVLFVWWVV